MTPPPTVTVELYGTLAHAAGERTYQIEAKTIRDVLAGLADAAPAIADRLETGVSVSIDGRIYTEALFEPVTAESEIIILPRIAGG